MFARAYSGFPVELYGVGELDAAFLNESRTRGCWWSPVQEIRIHGPKKTGRSPSNAFTLWAKAVHTGLSHCGRRLLRGRKEECQPAIRKDRFVLEELCEQLLSSSVQVFRF
jgi:hypothetical protein